VYVQIHEPVNGKPTELRPGREDKVFIVKINFNGGHYTRHRFQKKGFEDWITNGLIFINLYMKVVGNII